MFKEFNFDGLIGPTHNFGGLAAGNLASAKNRFRISHPRAAALQGLAKMKWCVESGYSQGFIPPQERPNLRSIKERGGYTGSDRDVLDKAGRQNFELLLQCSSASSMWAANAATVSPSVDSGDGKIHVTTANLATEAHRAIEPFQTTEFLKRIFSDQRHFVHHVPLNPKRGYHDEGAANHMRLWAEDNKPGLEFFIFGDSWDVKLRTPQRYPARQNKEASAALARQHKLDAKRCIFIQQNPDAIDAGVFHNDVIAMSHRNILIYHEQSFEDQTAVMDQVREKFSKISSVPLSAIEILSQQLSLKDVVSTYFFNSQLLGNPGQILLLSPVECRESSRVQKIIQSLRQKAVIQDVHYVDLRESMANGGGPACLRLRVLMNPQEQKGNSPAFQLDKAKIQKLEKWIHRHYREKLEIQDLRDYALFDESRRALDELTRLIGCGSIYDFQR